MTRTELGIATLRSFRLVILRLRACVSVNGATPSKSDNGGYVESGQQVIRCVILSDDQSLRQMECYVKAKPSLYDVGGFDHIKAYIGSWHITKYKC